MDLSFIPLWTFSVVLYGLLLFGAKFAKPKTFFEDALSLKTAKGIQGFCALGIVLHHLTQRLATADLTGVGYFADIGVLFVAIFFFFSGYGLYLSFCNKKDYLDTFMRRRMTVILVPYFIISWIYIIVRYLTGETISLPLFFNYFTTLLTPNTNSWYIVETIFLYLIFYFTFRYIKNKNIAYLLNGVGALLIMTVAFLSGHCYKGDEWFKGEWWFNTTLMFFAGITYAKFRHVLFPLIKKFYWFLLPVFVGLYVLFLKLTNARYAIGGYWTETPLDMHYGDKFMTLIVQFPMILFFTIAFLLLTMKVQFGNRVLRFLGTFTIELYLVQNLFIGYLGDTGYIKDSVLFVIVCYALTIAVGYALHILNQLIIKKIRGK